MTKYASPLAGFESGPPLPTDVIPGAMGRCIVKNLSSEALSSVYDTFPAPIHSGEQGHGFDFHIYYMANSKMESRYATELHERLRREFPELTIFTLVPHPAGPHPVATLEVDVTTPSQLGALMAFLVVHRGPLSVLIHPNTGRAIQDHTDSATWMGKPWPLDVEFLETFTGFNPVNSIHIDGQISPTAHVDLY